MSIEVGAKLSGKVSGITNFGAFVDLGGGKTGLVHISEVSSGYIKDIHDVLSVGDDVTVKVLTIGDDGKIGLSIRKASENEESQKPRSAAPKRNQHRTSQSAPKKAAPKSQDFDALMSSFLKESDDRLSSLRRNTEGKRGGRGGRRS